MLLHLSCRAGKPQAPFRRLVGLSGALVSVLGMEIVPLKTLTCEHSGIHVDLVRHSEANACNGENLVSRFHEMSGTDCADGHGGTSNRHSWASGNLIASSRALRLSLPSLTPRLSCGPSRRYWSRLTGRHDRHPEIAGTQLLLTASLLQCSIRAILLLRSRGHYLRDDGM